MSEDMSASGNVRPIPDPTERTAEQILLNIENLEKLTAAKRDGEVRVIGSEIAALKRELEIKETHRLEMKADQAQHRLELKAGDEKALSTAMIAAERAVQAALAAAEKARDQQTIASQLATEKATLAGKEQMEQQGTTFSLAISGLTTGLNDLKTLVSELRTEKKVTADTTVERRASNSQITGFVGLFSGALLVILARIFGL